MKVKYIGNYPVKLITTGGVNLVKPDDVIEVSDKVSKELKTSSKWEVKATEKKIKGAKDGNANS